MKVEPRLGERFSRAIATTTGLELVRGEGVERFLAALANALRTAG